jgi:multiple sugar transport system permease protein
MTGVYILLILVALLYIAPFYWMINTALKPQREIFMWPPTVIPRSPTLENYRRVFEIIPVLRIYMNTIIITVVPVVFQILFGSLGGYVFEKLRFPFKETIFTGLLVTMMIPFQVTVVPLYLMIERVRLVDTLLAVILPYVITPFSIFLFRQNIKSIPNDLLDSAKLDGCGTMGRYWLIVMPLVKAATGTVLIFSFRMLWTVLLWPVIIIDSSRKRVLEQALASFTVGDFAIEEGARMAGATIAVIPILLVFFFAQRYFVKGVALTGIKG